MAPDRNAVSASIRTEIEALVEEWLESESIPGASVVVADRDGIRYANGFGVRDVESDAPATPDTLYAVASLTKSVTAIAVLQLVERGDIDLEDELREYVAVLNEAPGPPITVRELLAHSSGMPQDFVARRPAIDDGRDLDLFEHVDGAADRRLVDDDRYMYYNGGYFVLGELVEAVDGRPYEEYVRTEIFEPLGMTRSTYDPDALVRADDAMTGYTRADGELTPDAYDGGAGPAGGLISSARELATVLRCVLNDGTVDGTRILEPDLVESMCGRQSPSLPTVDGTYRGYGYGWEVRDFLDETLVSHLGGIGVSGAYMGCLREHDVAVAMAFNTHGPSVTAVGAGILAALCGERPEDAVRALRVREAIDAVAGTYESYRGALTATVEPAAAGTIRIRVPERDVAFTASPDAVERSPYSFSAGTGSGVRWTAEFRDLETELQLILSMGKWTAVLTDR